MAVEIMMKATLVKPESLANKEFFGLWLRESLAALGAIEAGAMKHIWKVAGRYEVIAVMEVEDGAQMDAALHSLPIWQEGFAHVVTDVEWTPLHSYQNWSDQLKELAAG